MKSGNATYPLTDNKPNPTHVDLLEHMVKYDESHLKLNYVSKTECPESVNEMLSITFELQCEKENISKAE